MIFPVFDSWLLTQQINCSFYYYKCVLVRTRLLAANGFVVNLMIAEVFCSFNHINYRLTLNNDEIYNVSLSVCLCEIVVPNSVSAVDV